MKRRLINALAGIGRQMADCRAELHRAERYQQGERVRKAIQRSRPSR